MISIDREKLLSELEQKIGYSFRSRALLDRALTHRSFANERAAQNCQHNEAMEFLGDAVLGFVVSAWLLERFPALSEGKLSKMKAHLVSESSLVELAEAIDLGRYILLNRGEEKTGGRRKRALLADAYEALIGVVYVDGGIGVAERFLRRELRDKLQAIDPMAMIGTDYKSALQESLQAAGGPVPEYAVIEVLGPDHCRTFRIELRVSNCAIARGEGHTIKIAQQEAARLALGSPEALLSAVEEYREKRAVRNNGGPDSGAAPSPSTATTEGARTEDAGAEEASPLEEMGGDGLALEFNANSTLDFDEDGPLGAIAAEIEAARVEDTKRKSAGASFESEDKIESSEEEARGIATDA
ncbi:MAG TPA: ribonuclease III [Blastocatellia bacterium]|nr:ribonuclease III [Blastocatellia bacterium]